MMARHLYIVMISIAVAGPAPAQTTLAWKFRAGATFDVHQQITQTTSLETKNKPFQQKSLMTLQTRWQVKEVRGDKATLAVAVTAMDSKSYPGDGKVAVPSKDDDQWRGAEFVLSVDSHGRLHGLKGHEELLKKLAGNNPQRLKVLTALKPPESFRMLFQDVLGPLPEKAVVVGDDWQHSAVDAMSIFGSFQQATTFTYCGVADGEHRIDSITRTTYKAPRYAIENDVFRVLKGEVTADDGQGSLHFDVAQGRMRRLERSAKVQGELTLETLSGPQRVTFTSVTKVEVHVRASER
jgi:hypothetical protein